MKSVHLCETAQVNVFVTSSQTLPPKGFTLMHWILSPLLNVQLTQVELKNMFLPHHYLRDLSVLLHITIVCSSS